MRPETYYMLSFPTMHYAMRAEAQLKPVVPLCVMPTLREVTQSCGISLRVEEAHFPLLLAALTDMPLEAYTLYRVSPAGVYKMKSD